MLLSNAPRPTSLQLILEQFWLPCPCKGSFLNLFDEFDYTKGGFTIMLNPPCQIFKGIWVKFDGFHSKPS